MAQTKNLDDYIFLSLYLPLIFGAIVQISEPLLLSIPVVLKRQFIYRIVEKTITIKPTM